MEITFYTNQNQIDPQRGIGGLAADVSPQATIRDALDVVYQKFGADPATRRRAATVYSMMRDPRLTVYPLSRIIAGSVVIGYPVDLTTPISQVGAKEILLERRRGKAAE